jgi:hypothetical protein
VLVVLALVAAGVVAVGTLGYCSVFGCTFFAEDFEPEGDEATAARASAVADTAALADRLVAGRSVLAAGTADGCITGQNNWKIKDTYSHECSVLDSRVVLVTTDVDAVGDGLTAADAALREAGCAPASPRSGLDRVREEYWRPDNPQVQRLGAAGLPGATYTCPEGLTVAVDPTGRNDRKGALPVASHPVFLDEVLHQDWYTAADATALQESGAELALVVTVESTYYRTRF